MLDSAFLKNILKLSAGTGLGQVFTLLAAPVIARIYGPDVFGEQNAILALVSLISVLGSMSLPLAIVVADDDNEVNTLVILAISSTAILSAAFSSLLMVHDSWLLRKLSLASMAPYIAVIPIFAVLFVLNTSAGFSLARRGAFSRTATASVLSALMNCTSKIALGIVAPSTISLMAGNAIGYVIAPLAALRYSPARKNRRFSFQYNDLRLVFWRYRDFAFWRTPQTFIWTLSQSLPVLVLTSFFGVGPAGYYSLALAVLNAPIALAGGAVQTVFYPRVVDLIKGGADVSCLLKKVTVVTVAGGFVLLFPVALFGKYIFATVFGEEWKDAGSFAAILVPLIWSVLSNKPAIAAIPPLGLQRGLLFFEFLSTGTKVFSILIGAIWFQDALICIALFSVTSAGANTVLILWVLVSSSAQSRKSQL